jgi:hypothetical protein
VSRSPAAERAGEAPHLLQPAVALRRPHGNSHELEGAAEHARRVADIHGIEDHPAAGLLHQPQRRLLHHARVDLAASQRLEEVRAECREARACRVGARLLHEVEDEHVIGIAEAGDSDRAPLQRAEVGDLVRRARRSRERKERQPPG